MPLLVAPLVILPFAHGYAQTVALVSLFFVGYHIYYPPYQALFAELVPASHQGRAQGWQGVMRGLGLGVALVAGGLLLSVWTPLPFLLGAAAAVLATVVLVREIGGKERPAPVASPDAPRGPGVFQLVRERSDVRAFVAANALWELSFMGLKTFIVLFVVKGLGESVGTASAVIGVVAGAYVIAAFGAGRLGDAIGIHRLMRISIWVYGVGLLVGAGLSSLDSFLIGLPFIALAGAVVMTLPYGILAGMTPRRSRGRALRALRLLPRARRRPRADRGRRRHRRARARLPLHERLRRHVGGDRRADPALAALPRRAPDRGARAVGCRAPARRAGRGRARRARPGRLGPGHCARVLGDPSGVRSCISASRRFVLDCKI